MYTTLSNGDKDLINLISGLLAKTEGEINEKDESWIAFDRSWILFFVF